jgi:hypothetical protein
MTALSSYSTGTVAVSADGTTVTGSSTLWLNTGNVRPGDLFQSGHFCVPITDVTDDTHMVITPWSGATLSGASYTVWNVSQQRIVGETYARSVDQLVSALDTTGFFVFVGATQTVPDPSLGNDGQYAFQPTTGKTWAKSGGTWIFLGIYKGFSPKGAYDNAATYSLNDVVTSGGSSYIWINATPGSAHAPPDAAYWQLLANKGDTGTTGATGAPGVNAPTYGGTSTTSISISVASKAYTIQTGLAYQNARVRATATADVTKWQEGPSTYDPVTGILTINVDKTNGSGTFTAWKFDIVGQPGAGDMSSVNYASEYAGHEAQVRANLGIPAVTRGHIAGLTLSTAGSSATFSVAAGVATDSTNVDHLSLASSINKATGSWAVGSGNGAWDGAGANPASGTGWYSVYLIKRPDTGVIDVLISQNGNAPTLPTNYTLYRRIGSLCVDSSNHWYGFTQTGDTFLWATAFTNMSSVAASTTAASVPVTVPKGVVTRALFRATLNASGNIGVLFSSLQETDQSPAAPSGNVSLAQTSGFAGGHFAVLTDTSQQIRVRSNTMAGTISLSAYGWVDTRGK